MGVDYFLIKSSVVGLMAQRLVKRLCSHCKAPSEIDEGLNRLYNLNAITERYPFLKGTTYRAVGCPHCHGTGFSGRIPIVEIAPFSHEIKQAFDHDSSHDDLSAFGYRTLLEDGLAKYLDGYTTIEEVLKTVQ